MSQTNQQDLSEITLLGNQNTKYEFDYNPDLLQKFKKKFEDSNEDEQIVSLDCFEFASRCVTGDTLIKVARNEDEYPDGIPISDLVGTSGYVFCFDPESEKSECRRFHDVRKTGSNMPVVKVTLVKKFDGSEETSTIRCTPDHKFLVRTHSHQYEWVEASDLTSGMHLVYSHRVVCVEPDGFADVYNMEVEGLHNFFANDVVIHNCPKTGQPDFATIHISYIPNEYMVESKSLKLYLFSYQQHGDFHETCVHTIMQDLVYLLQPKYLEVYGDFNSRGGISILPFSVYADDDHQDLKKSRQLSMMQYSCEHRPRTS